MVKFPCVNVNVNVSFMKQNPPVNVLTYIKCKNSREKIGKKLERSERDDVSAHHHVVAYLYHSMDLLPWKISPSLIGQAIYAALHLKNTKLYVSNILQFHSHLNIPFQHITEWSFYRMIFISDYDIFIFEQYQKISVSIFEM